jgi:hypothetical protein
MRTLTLTASTAAALCAAVDAQIDRIEARGDVISVTEYSARRTDAGRVFSARLVFTRPQIVEAV